MAGSLLPCWLVLCLVLFTSSTCALRITPDSSCSPVCGDTATTSSSDIVCNDYDYYASPAGSTFMSCMECLQHTRDLDSAVSWFLYNLRYASAVCLFDFPVHNASASRQAAACNANHACKPLQGAIVAGNLDPASEAEYGYCQAGGAAFYGTSIGDCMSCLRTSASAYTANFLVALKAGCEQEPAPGVLLNITGSLFTTAAIGITSPSHNSTTTPSSSSASAASSFSSHQFAITTIIAIAVSITALFLAAAALFTLYCLRQRRYAREDAHLARPSTYLSLPHPHHPGDGYLYYGKDRSSDSGRGAPTGTHSTTTAAGPAAGATGPALHLAPPQYTVDYKAPWPQAPAAEDDAATTPATYNSNAEYYDRLAGLAPEHPVRLTAAAAAADNAALPTHPAYIPRSVTPGALGGRASRAGSVGGSSRSAARESTARLTAKPQPQPQHASYAMEVYRDGRGDDPAAGTAAAPTPPGGQRNLDLQLRGSLESGGPDDNTSATSFSKKHHHHKRITPPPPVSLANRRRLSLSPSPPPPDRSMTSTPATISSLLLPPVPRIRLLSGGGKKPPRFQVPDQSALLDKNMGISGPLAFPDSRFTGRPGGTGPGQDRIVEQTVVDRGRRGPTTIEVPIGSGKSYLYG